MKFFVIFLLKKVLVRFINEGVSRKIMNEDIDGEEGIMRSLYGKILGGTAGLASAVGVGIGLDFFIQHFSPETPYALRLTIDIASGIVSAPLLAKKGAAIGEYVFYYSKPAVKKIGKSCKDFSTDIGDIVKYCLHRKRGD